MIKIDFDDNFNYSPCENCIICDRILTQENKSKESSFPKWLLDWFDEKDILKHHTEEFFDELEIPCCSECFDEVLLGLDKEIEDTVFNGYDAFIKIPKHKIALWTAKVYLGLFTKEYGAVLEKNNRLAHDLRDDKELEKYLTTFLIIRSMFKMTDFDEKLYSLLVFNVRKNEKSNNYSHYYNLGNNVIFLRIEEVGIILSLQDGSLMEQIFKGDPKYSNFMDKEISFEQFVELFSHYFYNLALSHYTPAFSTIKHEGMDQVFLMNPPHRINLEFAPWEKDEYYEYFEFLTQFLTGKEVSINDSFL